MSAGGADRRGLRLWPRHIGAQIAVLVLLAAVFTYAGNYALVKAFEHRPDASGGMMMNGAILFAALPVLGEADPDKRQAIIDLVNLMAPNLDMVLETPASIPVDAGPFGNPQPPPDDRGAQDNRPPPRNLARLYSLGEISNGTTRLARVLAVLPDGAGIRGLVPLPEQPPPSFLSPQFMMANWLVLFVIVLPIALIWAVLGVSRPLRRFARAAEEYSLDGDYAPLPEVGPEEVRVVARALNAMRQRVAAMASDRTRMLSAIGHDLRTPVTRMRLRAEFITDEETRAGQLGDLARMETMIDNTLSFLRDGQVQDVRAATDLVSLAQTLIDDFADLGSRIGFEGPDRLVVTIEPDSIRRMIENLIQNSLKFADEVVLKLTANEKSVCLCVEDDGPGIPEAERAAMLKPFVTGNEARNEAGFGLGLSIAESVTRAHGGALELQHSSMGGLAVRITLPRG